MIDVVLLVICLICIIYCCDFPVWLDLQFLVNDKDSMWYGIGLSIIAAYVFYMIQVFIPTHIRKAKYKKLVFAKLEEIASCMGNTISILAGKAYVEGENIDYVALVEENLEAKSLFSDGARVNKNYKEMVIIDALWENEEKIHKAVMELISLNIVREKVIKVLLEIEKLKLRNIAQDLTQNKPGNITTIEQTKGHSYGGAVTYNMPVINKDIVEIIKQYVSVLKSLENMLKTFY